MNSKDKLERLADVARLYYEQDRTQNEIAGMYHISRPMVSRLLKEARDCGIVTIKIQVPVEKDCSSKTLMERLSREFGILGGVSVKDGPNDYTTNAGIAKAAVGYIRDLKPESLGLGWGHIIGDTVAYIEQQETDIPVKGTVCPLIGNGGVGLKNYHSNELVRVVAEHSQAQPKFLYSPACVMSEQEQKLMRELDNYRVVYKVWEELDTALVNIGNFPSVPDFASEARFGDLLIKRKAVGRILNYFIDAEGHVIHADTDYAIQIPLELLSRVRHVVGICSANTSAKALRGALRSGYLNHLLAPEHVIKETLEV